MKFFGLNTKKSSTVDSLLDPQFDAKANHATIDIENLDADGDAVNIVAQGTNLNETNHLQFNSPVTDTEKVSTYRKLSKTSEIDEAVGEIVNELFIFENGKRAFEIDFLDDCELTDKLKEKISDEAKLLYGITKFNTHGAEYANRFYVDGRVVFQKVVDTNNLKKGITNVVRIDPTKIMKVRLLPPRDATTSTVDTSKIKNFFVYTTGTLNKKNYLNNTWNSSADAIEGLKISTGVITYVTSGIYDPDTGVTIGHLDKAIQPYNNLKMMEQSMVIFRVVRAPMRKAFYIDVSKLAKPRAEEYMKNMSKKFKTKLVYNVESGSWLDQKSVLSMSEDYFIPRYSDNKTTEIQNIDGQSSQEILEEVEYMKDKLYRALNVPLSRFVTDPVQVFVFGKSSDVQRDEFRFKKFIDKVRIRFMMVFDDMLRTNLILKGVISPKDWDSINNAYYWKFAEDNAIIEYKDSEIINNRLAQLSVINDYVGTYFSKLYVMKNILKQSDDEIAEMQKQIDKEPKFDPNEEE